MTSEMSVLQKICSPIKKAARTAYQYCCPYESQPPSRSDGSSSLEDWAWLYLYWTNFPSLPRCSLYPEFPATYASHAEADDMTSDQAPEVADGMGSIVAGKNHA